MSFSKFITAAHKTAVNAYNIGKRKGKDPSPLTAEELVVNHAGEERQVIATTDEPLDRYKVGMALSLKVDHTEYWYVRYLVMNRDGTTYVTVKASYRHHKIDDVKRVFQALLDEIAAEHCV
jgi:hypothetical protein